MTLTIQVTTKGGPTPFSITIASGEIKPDARAGASNHIAEQFFDLMEQAAMALENQFHVSFEDHVEAAHRKREIQLRANKRLNDLLSGESS